MRSLTAVAITVVGLLVPARGAEASCDCNHFPWKPERCVKQCGGLILTLANSTELTEFLDLSPGMAQKVILLRRNSGNRIASLDALRPSFSSQEYQGILKSVNGLGMLDAQYLVQSPEEREDFYARVLAAPPSLE